MAVPTGTLCLAGRTEWHSGVHHPLPPADVDIDFYDDILDNIKGALFLVGEARKGRLGIIADFAYNDIEMEDPTPGQAFTLLALRTQSWIVSAAGFYRLTE